MKKTISLIALLAFLLLNGCAVIKYTEDGQEIKDEKRIFYVVGGLANITDNTVKAGDEYVVQENFVDVLITALTGGIIYSRTVKKK